MASSSAALLAALEAVHDELNGAVLFVDDVSAAALALGVGLSHLLDMGVLNVLPLGIAQPPANSPALPGQRKYNERDGDVPRKAVVLCSGLVYEAHEAIRRSLCQPCWDFASCIVLSSFSAAAHDRHANAFAGANGHATARANCSFEASSARIREWLESWHRHRAVLKHASTASAPAATTTLSSLSSIPDTRRRGHDDPRDGVSDETHMDVHVDVHVDTRHLDAPLRWLGLGAGSFVLPSPLSALPLVAADDSADDDTQPELEAWAQPGQRAARDAASGDGKADARESAVLAEALSHALGARQLRPVVYALGPRAQRLGAALYELQQNQHHQQQQQLSQHQQQQQQHHQLHQPPGVSKSVSAESHSPRSVPPRSPNPLVLTDASLILIDRSLDLVSPCLHSDHPLSTLNTAHIDAGARTHTAHTAHSPTRDATTGETRAPHTQPAAAARTRAADACDTCTGGAEAAQRSDVSGAADEGDLDADLDAVLDGSSDGRVECAGIEISSEERGLLELLSPEVASVFDALLIRRPSEAPAQILKIFASLLDDAEIDVQLPPRASWASLRKLLDETCAEHPSIVFTYAPMLDAISLVISAGDQAAAVEPLVAEQMVLLHTASEAPLSAFASLNQIAARDDAQRDKQSPTGGGGGGGGGRLRAMLPSFALLFSLLGNAALAAPAAELQQRLRQTLLQAGLRDCMAGAPWGCASSFQGTDLVEARAALDLGLRRLFATLRAVAAARANAGKAEQLLLSGSETQGEVYRPLLRALVERLNTVRVQTATVSMACTWSGSSCQVPCIKMLRGDEMAELHRFSQPASSFFRRGASLLGVVARPRPSDNRCIVVMVVGGISLREMRDLRQIAVQNPKHQFLVGGTQIVTPQTIGDELVMSMGMAADTMPAAPSR